MDLGDDVAQRASIECADPHFVADAHVPEREEHAAARVRIEVAVRAAARDRRTGQMERVRLWRLLCHGVALDVAFEDREINAQARDLDAVPGPDRRQWRWGGPRPGPRRRGSR